MKTYEIEKYNTTTDNWENLGKGYSEEDVKAITKGYKFTGLFYERKNSLVMFIVKEG